MNAADITTISVNSFQLLVFLAFLFMLRRLLIKEGPYRLDIYMKLTIILITISLILLQPYTYILLTTGKQPNVFIDTFVTG